MDTYKNVILNDLIINILIEVIYKMNFDNELSKIYNELNKNSLYFQEIQNRCDVSYAYGFVSALSLSPKEKQEYVINSLVAEIKDNGSNTIRDTILRLWDNKKEE